MNLCLIPASKDNQNYIWDVYTNAMRPHIEKIWGWDLAWQENDFANALNKYNTNIITLDDYNVGYVQYLNSVKNIYINMLIIEPSFQSQGLGKAIIDQISAINPLVPIELRCFCVNLKALDFYLRNGFGIAAQDTEFFTLIK